MTSRSRIATLTTKNEFSADDIEFVMSSAELILRIYRMRVPDSLGTAWSLWDLYVETERNGKSKHLSAICYVLFGQMKPKAIRRFAARISGIEL